MNLSERLVGYILLTLGIIIMFFAAIQIIAVFTGNAKPIKMFSMDSKMPTQQQSNQTLEDLIAQLQQNPQTSLNTASLPTPQLIDPKIINDILNLTVYYVIMQFILGLGFKLSNLGVQLLRPIVIQTKDKKIETIANDISASQPASL